MAKKKSLEEIFSEDFGVQPISAPMVETEFGEIIPASMPNMEIVKPQTPKDKLRQDIADLKQLVVQDEQTKRDEFIASRGVGYDGTVQGAYGSRSFGDPRKRQADGAKYADMRADQQTIDIILGRAQKSIDTYSKKDQAADIAKGQEKSWLGELIGGLGDTNKNDIGDILFMDMPSISHTSKVNNILEKSSKGEKLNDEEQQVLNAYKISLDANKALADEGGATISTSIGQSLPPSAGYMAQTFVTGGPLGITRTAATKGAKALGNLALTAVAAEAARTPFRGAMYKNLQDRTSDQYSITDDGTVVKDNETSIYERLWKSYATTFSEGVTEQGGNVLGTGWLGKSLKSVAPRLLGAKLGSAVLKSADDVARSTKAFREVLQKTTGYNGTFDEFLEEEFNSVIEPLLTGEPERLADNFTLENQLITLGSVATFGGIIHTASIPSAVEAGARKHSARRTINKSIGSIETPEIRQQVYDATKKNITTEDRAKAIAALDWANMSIQDRAHTIDAFQGSIALDQHKGFEMSGSTQEQLNARIGDFNTTYQQYKHRETGELQALQDGEGNEYFLLSGSLYDNGADATIFVRNSQTGMTEQVNRDTIIPVGQPISYEDALQQIIEATVQHTPQEVADVQDSEDVQDAAEAGVDPVSYNQGDNITTIDGQQGEFIGYMADGSNMVQVAFFDPEIEEQTTIEMPQSQILGLTPQVEIQSQSPEVSDPVSPQVQEPQIPLLKNGEPDYNAMPAAMFVEQYGKIASKEEAVHNLANEKQALEKQVLRLKNTKSTDRNTIVGNRKKITELTAKIDDISSVLPEVVTENKTEKKAPIKHAMIDLNDYVSIEDYILRDIASGTKFSWADKGNSHGLARELGLQGKEAERRQRIGLISNEGTTPELYAQNVMQHLGVDIPRFNVDEQDVRDAVIDILSTTISRSQAAQRATELHSDNFDEQMADHLKGKLEKHRLEMEQYDAALDMKIADLSGENFAELDALFAEESLPLQEQKQNNNGYEQTNYRETFNVQDAPVNIGQDQSRTGRPNSTSSDREAPRQRAVQDVDQTTKREPAYFEGAYSTLVPKSDRNGGERTNFRTTPIISDDDDRQNRGTRQEENDINNRSVRRGQGRGRRRDQRKDSVNDTGEGQAKVQQQVDPIASAATLEEKHQAVSRYVNRLNELSGADAIVFSQISELPQEIATIFSTQWENEVDIETPGVSIGASVYIFSPQIRSEEDLKGVYVHEIAAHRNIFMALGQNRESEKLLYSHIVDDIGISEMGKYVSDEYFTSLVDRCFNDPTNEKKVELGKEFVAYYATEHFDIKDVGRPAGANLFLNLSDGLELSDIQQILNTANNSGNGQKIIIESSSDGYGGLAYENDNSRGLGKIGTRSGADTVAGGSDSALASENAIGGLSRISENSAYSKDGTGGLRESETNNRPSIPKSEQGAIGGYEPTDGSRYVGATGENVEQQVDPIASAATVEEKYRAVSQYVNRLNELSGADAIVILDIKQLPESVANIFSSEWEIYPHQEIPGVIFKGKVYIYAPHIHSEIDLNTVYNHEVAGHLFIDNSIKSAKEKLDFFNAVVDGVGVEDMQSLAIDELSDEVNRYKQGEISKWQLGREYIAYLTQNNFRNVDYQGEIKEQPLYIDLLQKITSGDLIKILKSNNNGLRNIKIGIGANDQDGLFDPLYSDDQQFDRRRDNGGSVVSNEDTYDRSVETASNVQQATQPVGQPKTGTSSYKERIREYDVRAIGGAEPTNGSRDADATGVAGLRGVSPTDAIYNGTERRSTVGFADVTRPTSSDGSGLGAGSTDLSRSNGEGSSSSGLEDSQREVSEQEPTGIDRDQQKDSNSKSGQRYYDHKLTRIEKGKLLSTLPVIHKSGEGSNLPNEASSASVSQIKDTGLISILQPNDQTETDDLRFRDIGGSYRQEVEQIKAEAIERGDFLKAPNGEPSNLTEHQWLQVRTKAFKEWFGDWEKSARIEKLRKAAPVEITGQEITPSDDLKEYRRNAMEYGKTLRGKYTNIDTGQTIELTGGSKLGGLRELFGHDFGYDYHLKSIAAIPKIIEKSIYITTIANENPNKPQITSNDYYVCGIKIANDHYTVKAVVANSKDGKKYYDHKLSQIEKGQLLTLLEGLSMQSADNGYPNFDKENTPLSQYKDIRLLSILQNNSSKVVDANGEPMVVYHGSRNSNSFLPVIHKSGEGSNLPNEASSASVSQIKDTGLISILQPNDQTETDDLRFRDIGGSYRQEVEQIKAEAIERGDFLKAPNGEPSNLTEHQWLQVRTKAFKEWFGDWEKSARIEKLRKAAPVEITGKEIADTQDRRILKPIAEKYGLDNCRDNYINKDTGNVINVARDGIRETVRHGYELSHLQSIAAIPSMIENSTYITSLPNEQPSKKSRNIRSFDYYVVGLNIDKEHYTAKIAIGIDAQGNKFYDHALTQIEKSDLISQLGISVPINENQTAQSLEQGVLIDLMPAISSTVSKANNSPLSQYKDIRLLSILQNNSSKVVDANGEPMVVYHGSRNSNSFWQFAPNVTFFTDDLTTAEVFKSAASHKTVIDGTEHTIDMRTAMEIQSIIEPYEDLEWAMGWNLKNADLTDDQVSSLEELLEIDDLRNIDEVRLEKADNDIFKVFLNIRDPKTKDYQAKMWGEQGAVIEHDIDKNADGFIAFNIREGGLAAETIDGEDMPIQTTFVVFEPSQIKSATVNEGTFDSQNPDIRYRAINDINAKFNAELQQLLDGSVSSGHVFELGMPVEALLLSGIPNLPIELSATRLKAKSEQENHKFDLGNVVNLPAAIANPIAVFDSKTQNNSKVILTEISNREKNFIVAIRTQRHDTSIGQVLNVNEIRSLYPKDFTQIEKWIAADNLLRWIDKEKAIKWFDKQRSNSADVAIPDNSSNSISTQWPNYIGGGYKTQGFNDVTKVIGNFENPTSDVRNRSYESLIKEAKDQYEYEQAKETQYTSPEKRQEQVVDQLQKLAAKFSADVVILDSKQELPYNLRYATKNKRFKGLYNKQDGKVYFIAGEIKDVDDATATYLHEVVAHKGLDGLLGQERAERFYAAVFDALKPEEQARLLADYKSKLREGGVYNEQQARIVSGDEVVARMAEGDVTPGVMQRIISAIRKFFREVLGIPLTIKDDDIRYILFKSKNNLENAKNVSEVFSVLERDQALQKQLYEPILSSTEQLYKVNSQFNDAIKRYADGTMKSNEYINVGKPFGALGEIMPNLPIILKQSVITKSINRKHDVSIDAIRDLPLHISQPIFIFQRDDRSIGILTEIEDKDNKNVCVAIKIDTTMQDGGQFIEVNEITTIHGRDNENIILPIIHNNSLIWSDKEKGLDWISSVQSNGQELTKKDLVSATKVIENFHNSTTEIRYKKPYAASLPLMEQIKDVAVRYREIEPTRHRVSGTKGSYASNAIQFQEKIQDQTIKVHLLQKDVEERGGAITPLTNVYESLNHVDSIADAQMKKYSKNYIAPVVDLIKQFGKKYALEYKTVTDYMLAKHSIERHDSGTDALSDQDDGWNRATANDKIESFEKQVTKQELDEFWATWSKATTQILEIAVDSGRMSLKDKRDILNNKWLYYVPLRGKDWDFEDQVDLREVFYYDNVGQDRGTNTSKKIANIKAKGRRSKAADPIAALQHMANVEIYLSSINKARRTLLRLVEKYPEMSDLFELKGRWYVKSGEEWRETDIRPSEHEIKASALARASKRKYEQALQNETDEQVRAEIEKQIALADGQITVTRKSHETPAYEGAPANACNVIVMKDGVKYVVELKDTEVAQAINGKSDGVSRFLSKYPGKVTRVLAQLATSKNPAFIAPNFIRDFQQAAMYSFVDSDGNTLGFLKYASSSWKTLHRDLANSSNPLTVAQIGSLNIFDKSDRKTLEREYGKDRINDTMYDLFAMNGGETGFVHILDPKDYQRKLEKSIRLSTRNVMWRKKPASLSDGGKEVAKSTWTATKKGWKGLNQGVDYLAGMSENAVRYAAFRSQLDRGSSVFDAVSYAKNITVNFNRKGQYSKGIGALFMFFNASVQGVANIYSLWGNKKGKSPKEIAAQRARCVAAFGMMATVGYWSACLVAEMLKGLIGDDDEQYQVSQYERLTNIIIPSGTEKGYIKIPIPIMCRPFYALGVMASDWVDGKVEGTDVFYAFGESIVDVMSPLPIGFSIDEDNAWSWTKAFIPSAIRPLAEIGYNQNFMGKPINKEAPYSPNTPDSELGQANVNKIALAASKWLNKLGGGNEVTPAGTNEFGEKDARNWLDLSPSTLEHIITGYTGGVGKMINETFITLTANEKEVRKIPIVNRFYGEAYEKDPSSEYYAIKRNIEWVNRNNKFSEENGEESALFDKDVFDEKKQEYRGYGNILKSTEKQISAIKKELEQHKFNTPQYNQYEKQIDKLQRQFIKQYNDQRD